MKSFMTLVGAVATLTTLLPKVSASCAHHTTHMKRAEVAAWDYSPLKGPMMWHTLSQDWMDCAVSTAQSPQAIDSVNYDRTVMKKRPKGSIVLDIPVQTKVPFERLGHTVEVVLNGTLAIKGNSKKFNVKQFHFHTPSEHHLDGLNYPAEMHIVSQSSTGELAVLGFLLDPEDVGAPVFDQFMKNVGALNQPEMVQTIKKIDMSSFIDTYVTPMSFMAYGGSLTTPPCSSGVNWFVATKPVPIKRSYLSALGLNIQFTSRFIQTLPGTPNLLEDARSGLCPSL